MDSICLLQLSSCITSLLTLCFPVVNCSKLNFSYSAHLQATEVEALILLSPRRGIQHYFYEEDFKLKTPELKYDPLRKELSHRRPEQVQGNLSWQQSCFGTLQHLISLCASRSVSDHSFKGLWGKVLPAVHTCEFLNCLLEHSGENNCCYVVGVGTFQKLKRRDHPLNNSCRTPAACTGKQT